MENPVISQTKQSIPLLNPYNMGDFNLSHRVVLAPLTRRDRMGTFLSLTLFYIILKERLQEDFSSLKPLESQIQLKGFQLNGQAPISCTNKPLTPAKKIFTPPRRLSTEEIPSIVNDFRLAA